MVILETVYHCDLEFQNLNQICHKEFPCLTDLRRIIPACSVPLFPYTLLWSDFIFAATAMSLLNHNCPLCLNHLLKRWNMMKSMCWIVLNCFDVGYDCHWLMGELWTLNVLWWAPSSAEALYQFYQRRLAEAPELAFFAGFPHVREG